MVVAVVAVLQPAIIDGLLGSPRALAITVGIIAATIGWSALLRRIIGSPPLRTLLVAVPLAVLGWLYVAPYFMGDEVVDEAFPPVVEQAEPSAVAEEPSAAEAPQSTTAAEAPAADPAPPAAAPAAPEDPIAGGAAPAGDIGTAPAEPTAEQPEPEQPPAAPPAGPVEISRGSFVGLDSHAATGDAAIYDLGGGMRIVRLEEVDLQRVPDPFVYLVPGADQTGPADGSVNLGRLTGNVGNSNYTIPADIDLASGAWTVLVWCEAFASPVGAASQDR